MLVRTNDDDTVEQSCVDQPLAAAEFLGIDSKTDGRCSAQTGEWTTSNTNPPEKNTSMMKFAQSRVCTLLLVAFGGRHRVVVCPASATITIQNSDGSKHRL
jgi:hypothetical protein